MGAYQSLQFRIIGASPLLHHNGQLADPLNPHAQAIAQVASKRKKTEADHRRLAELEFAGSLWLSGGAPCIPGEAMEAALVRAAQQERRGPKAKAGLVIRNDLRLEYDGPADPQALWADLRFRLRCGVRIGTSRVMRTRPQFTAWEADLVVDFRPELLNAQDIRNFITVAGDQVGVGDWRPRFGRFYLGELKPAQVQRPVTGPQRM